MERSYEPALQSLLQNYPELIPGKQIEPDSDDPPRFVLLRREMPVSGMSLDHLFVDQRGILTLVEAKLMQNPELRVRDVIGQIIEYAANAFDLWASGAARQYAAEYWNRQGSELDDVLIEAFGEEIEIEGFWDLVESNLRQGQIRMIIAADELRPEVRRMIEYLNSEMQNAEVLGLELKCYGSDADSVVMVPTISGRSETSRRAKTGSVTRNKTTPEELLDSLPEEAKILFQYIMDTADELRMTQHWGQRGFTVGAPDAEGNIITLIYAYPPETLNRRYPFIRAYGTKINDAAITTEILDKLLPLPQARKYGDQSVEIAVIGEGVESARKAVDLMFSFGDKIAGKT